MQFLAQRSLGGQSRRERIGALALVLALLVCTLLALGSFASRAEAAGSCTIPADSIAVNATDTSHPDAVQAWDNFRVQVSLSNLDDTPAGCTATVQLPDVFTGMAAKTLYLNADGTSSSTQHPDTVSVMQTDPSGRMTFTTTEYSATHEGVSVIGWANAQITDKVTAGSTQPLDFSVNGVVKQQQVHVATCDDCSALPAAPSKWGTENQDGSGTVTVQTPTADKAGSSITVSDALTSPGQTITGIGWVSGYNCVTAWNSPGTLGDDGTCVSGSTLPVDYTQSGQSLDFKSTVDHEFFRIGLKMQFTGDGPWTDTATVSVDGTPSTTSTTVRTYETGGSGTGHDKTTPTSPASTPTSPASTPTSPASTPTSPASTPTSPASTPTSPASTPTSPASTPTSPVTTPASPSSTSTPASPCVPLTSVSTPTHSSPVHRSTQTCGSMPGGPSGTSAHGAPAPGIGPKVQTDQLDGAGQLRLGLALAGIAVSGFGLVVLGARRSRG